MAWAVKTPALNPVNFLIHGCLMSNVYHDGKPEVSCHFLEAVEEAADVISNEKDATAEFGGIMISNMHKSAGGHVK